MKGFLRFVAAWRLALRIVALNFRAALEYRGELLVNICLGIAWQTSVIVFVTVLLGRFNGVGHWPARVVMLIAGVRTLSHGLYAIAFDRHFQLSTLVQEGRFDAFLFRPMPVYRQVQLASFPMNAIGDLCVGVAMFWLAIARADMSWSLGRVGYLCAAVIGCTLMEAAILNVFSSFQLQAPSASNWGIWLEELIGIFGIYPLSILPGIARIGFTYVLPLAFTAYLPAAVVAGRTSGLGVPAIVATCAPVVGLLTFLASRLIWNWRLSRYTGVNG